MSKAVLLSIKPHYCELIASGKKTVEVRKTRPKLETPFKCYIYCTKAFKSNKKYGYKTWAGRGKVIGEFSCNCITSFTARGEVQALWNETQNTCLSHDEIIKYAKGKTLYYWGIYDLVIYDRPKELSEFQKTNRPCWYADFGLAKRDCPECQNKGCFITRPPQSWCYVEEID